MRVGVLALQGGFAAHATWLRGLGHEVTLVRRASELVDRDALVLPGGESTVQLRLLERDGELGAALDAFATSGRPVLATCAGLILIARRVEGPAQASRGWLDVTVRRNAWGRQLDSFEAIADDGVTPLVCIRAPRIESLGPGVEVVLTYRGEPMAVRQGSIVGMTCHPELAGDGLAKLESQPFLAAKSLETLALQSGTVLQS
jgi:5'-phosphate synthase pdxT subunit